MNDWNQRLETLLRGALELLSPDQRASYFDRVCREDPALSEVIEKLLRTAEAARASAQPPAHPLERTRLLQSEGGDRTAGSNSARSDIQHPPGARGGWDLDDLVWDDGAAGIAVGLFRRVQQNRAGENYSTMALGLRWGPSFEYAGKEGGKVIVESQMGDETEWFILPFTFGSAIGKSLIEGKVAGLGGFDETGFRHMVDWLIEYQAVSGAFCY